MTATATIRVSRAGRGSNQGRPWEVLIDGGIVGSLHKGDTLELPVDKGEHGLRLRSTRILASPERSFDVAERQLVAFSCRERPRSPFIVQRSVFWFVVSLFTQRSWIILTLIEADETTEVAERSAAAGTTQASGTTQTAGTTETVTATEARSAPARVARPRLEPNGEPVLTVDQLTKRFGHRTAFSDVSFEVFRGEVFGFLGPNGAGKTTTVRTLGTLIAPTSGSATVAGIPLNLENGVAIRQRIAIMPEAPGLYLR
jgi:ABC-type multidrug transport system fused ATPase/permease subunit